MEMITFVFVFLLLLMAMVVFFAINIIDKQNKINSNICYIINILKEKEDIK